MPSIRADSDRYVPQKGPHLTLDKLPPEILAAIFGYLVTNQPGHAAVLDVDSAYDFTGRFLADRDDTAKVAAYPDIVNYHYDEICHPRRQLPCWHRSNLASLCLVSRRVRDIAQQLLYRAFCATGGPNPTPQIRHLLRTLRERPDLAAHMIELTVPLSHKEVRTYVDRLIAHTPHVQHLHLRRHGDHAPRASDTVWDNDFDAPVGACNYTLSSSALRSLRGGLARYRSPCRSSSSPPPPPPTTTTTTTTGHRRITGYHQPRRPAHLRWLTISSCRGCLEGNDLPERTFYFALAQARDILGALPGLEVLHLNYIPHVEHGHLDRPGAVPFDPRRDEGVDNPGPLPPPIDLQRDLQNNGLREYMSVAGKALPREALLAREGGEEEEEDDVDDEDIDDDDDDYDISKLNINDSSPPPPPPHSSPSSSSSLLPARQPRSRYRILENLTELALVQCNMSYLDLLHLLLTVGPHLRKATIWQTNWGLLDQSVFSMAVHPPPPHPAPLPQQAVAGAGNGNPVQMLTLGDLAHQRTMFDRIVKLEEALQALLPWKHTLRELVFGIDDQHYNSDLRPQARRRHLLLERLPQFAALEVFRTEAALLPLGHWAGRRDRADSNFLPDVLPQKSLRRLFLRGPSTHCALIDALFDMAAALGAGRFPQLETVEVNNQGNKPMTDHEMMYLLDVRGRLRQHGVELILHRPFFWADD